MKKSFLVVGGVVLSLLPAVSVSSPDADVLIPIRVEGFGREPYYAVVRDGAWRHDFGTAPAGELRVTNLATGELGVSGKMAASRRYEVQLPPLGLSLVKLTAK